MIKVFGQTDKNFASNADIVIQPLNATVHFMAVTKYNIYCFKLKRKGKNNMDVYGG